MESKKNYRLGQMYLTITLVALVIGFIALNEAIEWLFS